MTIRNDPNLDDDGDPDASRLVASYWPVDGPHSRGSVAAAALGIDELTRYLAHATAAWGAGPETLRYGGDIYRVVGELRSALGRLDQVLDQMAGRADNLGSGDDTLYDDRRDGRNPGDTAAAAAAGLRRARGALPALIDALASAHNAAGHLGHSLRSDGDDQ